jgi:aspartate kinase
MNITALKTSVPGTAAVRMTVLKLGGSVLRDLRSYHAYAHLIRDRLRNEPQARFIVVVSARFGETDELLSLARSLVSTPDSSTLDLLWSTGEIRSAAMLALCLQSLGVRAAALDVHQTGIRRIGRLDVDPGPLRGALEEHDVVIAPGFLAAGDAGRVVTIGRGGSDLSAVAIAAAIRADRCELIKDVPGYFTADPNHDANAQHLPAIDYRRALQMAADGCDLVQAEALETARRAGLMLVIRAADDPRQTVVTGEAGFEAGRGENDALRNANDSRGAVLGA